MAADYFNKLQTGGYGWNNNVAKQRQEQSRLDALVGEAEQAGVAEAKNREQQSRVDSAYQKGLGADRVRAIEPWLMRPPQDWRVRPDGPNIGGQSPTRYRPSGLSVLPWQQQTQQQTQNPYQTLATPRNQELADRVRELLSGQKAQQQKADTALNRYESALNKGGVKGYATQETDYLSNIYGGGLKAELSGLRDERATALRGAGDLAHQGLRRDLKLAGFRSRGGSGSRLDRMAADRSQQIEVGIANRMADQSRTDADYLNRLQMSSLGRRQGLMDSLASRELMSLQARSQLEGQQLNRLGQFGQLDRANQIYHLAETPEYTQSREYQAALEAQGMQASPVPGGGYTNYDMSQTDPWARFPKQPFTGYGVNPMNGLHGYQYAAPLYNNYPRVLDRV